MKRTWISRITRINEIKICSLNLSQNKFLYKMAGFASLEMPPGFRTSLAPHTPFFRNRDCYSNIRERI